MHFLGTLLQADYIRVSINGLTYNVSVEDSANVTLQYIVNKAACKHLERHLMIDKNEAAAMVENGSIRAISLQKADESFLDLDETVVGAQLSNKCLLIATLEGPIMNPLQYITPQAPHAALFQDIKYSSMEVVTATRNFSQENILGKGGMTTIYKGTLSGKPVAIKKYPWGDFRSLEPEIRAIQKLQHPNLIQIVGYCPEMNCIVHEYMVGGSLEDRMSESGLRLKPFSWAEKLRVVAEMVSGLHFLHCHDVLHLQLKPGNVLFDSHGSVKISGVDPKELSINRSQIGCPYMDPQSLKRMEFTKSTDVYSLGLLIIQICTHRSDVVEVCATISKNNLSSRDRCHIQGLEILKLFLVPSDGTLSPSKIT